jgi:hypothetical protein
VVHGVDTSVLGATELVAAVLQQATGKPVVDGHVRRCSRRRSATRNGSTTCRAMSLLPGHLRRPARADRFRQDRAGAGTQIVSFGVGRCATATYQRLGSLLLRQLWLGRSLVDVARCIVPVLDLLVAINVPLAILNTMC